MFSRLGQGSTFTLYLPHAYPPPASASAAPEGQLPVSGSEIEKLYGMPALGSGRLGIAPAMPEVRDETPGPSARDVGAPASPANPRLPLPPAPPSALAPASASPTPSTNPEATPVILPSPIAWARELSDDRADIQPGDRVLLIVEDDLNFARILLDMGRPLGFKVLVALRSDKGLSMAREFKPDAIILDIRLPGMNGWTVLDCLKHDPATRHIPVHILSVEEDEHRGLKLGARAYLKKPVTAEQLQRALAQLKEFVERPVKKLLLVEDDEQQRRSIVELIGNADVRITAVGTGAAALAAIKAERFDCVALHWGLPDINGLELIELIRHEGVAARGPQDWPVPVIVYTDKELTEREEIQLKHAAESVILKDACFKERLLDETVLFLHRVQASLPEAKRQMLEKFHQIDFVLAGKKVLIVDDDMRNIFALTSMLERHHMRVVYAENGRDGIALLQNTPDIDIVLMDVMMPEMDGYETMRAIRKIGKFRSLPMIALTAKAMQGDREKCLEAGASDYIPKPVDTEQLLSLLRVWLYQ